jgi:hypothetical protein
LQDREVVRKICRHTIHTLQAVSAAAVEADTIAPNPATGTRSRTLDACLWQTCSQQTSTFKISSPHEENEVRSEHSR